MTMTSQQTSGKTQYSPDVDKPPNPEIPVARVWRALTIVGSIAGFVFGLGLLAAKVRDIPDRVAKLERLADTTNKRLDMTNTKLDVIQEAVHRQTCLAVAERMNTPWQVCFQTR
jgi:hypothetical protein